jgi:membrane protein
MHMAAMAKSNLSTGEQLQSIWKLGGLRPKQLVRIVIRGINEDNLLGRAAELAFNLNLAIFPLMIFLLSVFGLFASHRHALVLSFFSYVSDLLPPAAFQLFTRTVSEIIHNTGGGKLTFGLVLTLWFASGGMSSMMSTLNGTYRVQESRSFIKYRAVALGLTVALAVLVLSALFLVLVGGHVSNLIAARFGMHSVFVILWRVVQWVAVLFFLSLAFSLIYYFGPDLKEQHWYWITPGSVLGVLLWLAASWAFRAYLHFFNSYSRTYGSLGAVMILMMWLYVTGLSFLIGGELNADIEHAAALRGHPEAKAPGEKKAA